MNTVQLITGPIGSQSMDSNNNKITHLSQEQLQKAITAGIYNVIEDQDYLNKINVFPVPDGDTGTNLTLTLSTIINNTEKKTLPQLNSLS